MLKVNGVHDFQGVSACIPIFKKNSCTFYFLNIFVQEVGTAKKAEFH